MNIVVVESNRHLLNSLERFLSSKGHKVITAFDGVIAVNNFDIATDLLIIDENLPRKDTSEIIRILKNKKPALKIVLLIDYLKCERSSDVSGVDDYLSIPFTSKSLDCLIENLVSNSGEHSRNLSYKEAYMIKNSNKDGLIKFEDIDEEIIKEEELFYYLDAINHLNPDKHYFVE